MKRVIKSIFQSFGLDVVRYKKEDFPRDFTEGERDLIRFVRPYTLTSNERIYTLIHAVQYVVKYDLPGDIVECGVWKGGSMMTVIKTLQNLQVDNKELYLYDTFEGMNKPTEHDTKIDGTVALETFEKVGTGNNSSTWCDASLDEVKKAVLSLGYDISKIHFVKGKVEETIPDTIPEKIALLRLDTDWYESTKHEMVHLFPRLVRGGVLILDDYGSWHGARKGVDEYLKENNVQILLNRIDTTGRIAVKL